MTTDAGWRSDRAEATRRLADIYRDHSTFPRDRSKPAWSVWITHQERAARNAAAQAQLTEIIVPVDDRTCPAVIAHYDRDLAAIITTESGQIFVTARGLEPAGLALVSLANTSSLLDD